MPGTWTSPILLVLISLGLRFPTAPTGSTSHPSFAIPRTFVVLDSPGLDNHSGIDRLANIIRSSPGLTQNEVIKQAGIQRRRAIELLQGHDGSQWQRQKGSGRSLRYFPVQVVPKQNLVESSRNHQTGVSESSSHADSKRREPLGITQAVLALPPFRGGNLEPLEYYGT